MSQCPIAMFGCRQRLAAWPSVQRAPGPMGPRPPEQVTILGPLAGQPRASFPPAKMSFGPISYTWLI